MLAIPLVLWNFVSTAQAQVVMGTPGAPNAKSTVDSRILPNMPGTFGGIIKQSAP
jgi:hypothetical protein